MSSAPSRRRDAALCLALVLATAAVYSVVVGYDFVNYDDPAYVTENPRVADGLTAAGVRWALTARHSGNWHPLTWLSHMVDVELFGLDPGAHHLVNLLFHLANTALVFLVLAGMTGAAWRSAFVAALFALHPLHVESAAWIAERKDVLSTLFGLLAVAAYAAYAKRPSLARYSGVVVLFALALMAKPMLVTLPLLFLLLDFWPLGRFPDRSAAGRLLLEKAPMLGLAAASSAITVLAQRSAGAVLELSALPPGVRLANAVVSYVAYLGKTVWPVALAIPYPYPAVLPGWKLLGALLLLIAGTAFAVRNARGRPYLIVGWLWYLIALIPVIGIVQVGDQAMADRYTYLPLLGIFVIVAWGMQDLIGARRHGRRILAVGAAVLLLALAARTRAQLPVWANTEALFRNAVAVTAGNHVAHTYLGVSLRQSGETDEAIEQLRAAIDLGAAFPAAPYTLGQIHEDRGDPQRAMELYRLALAMQPDHADALVNLGRVLESLGRSVAARKHFETALTLRPDHAPLHTNLGVVLTRLGRAEEAVAHLERAARLAPREVETLNNLGVAYLDLSRPGEAESRLRAALRLDPEHLLSRYNLGVALQRQGRLGEAVEQFETALGLEPGSAELLAALGDTRFRMGEPEKARDAYEEALRRDPGAADVRERLDLVRRQLGRPDEP